MSEEEISYYKIEISPFTKAEVMEIRNYLIAFTKKTVQIEGIKA